MWSQLLTWSKKEFEYLPWRKSRSLYGTLVSEIMLQQTTVTTVLSHFERFLKQFPDLKSLAASSDQEMLVAWKGLGYYRRAKNLKKIAEILVHEYGEEFPQDLEELQRIKGIGPYTANALVAIGMDKPALAVDANLERVLARVFALKTHKGPRLQKQIQQLFIEKKIIPDRHHSFRELNEALMDLGRTICQAKKAACEICPLKKNCQAFKEKNPLKYPVSIETATKKAVEHNLKLLRLVVRKGDKVLAYQKSKGEWLEGQWELPTFVIECDDEKFKQYPALKKKLSLKELPKIKTGITKYSIENYVLLISNEDWQSWVFERPTKWVLINDPTANLSTASTKCLKLSL